MNATVLFMETQTNETNLLNETRTKLERLNLSKAWAAKQVGVTSEYMINVLNGKKYLSKPMYDRLIQFNLRLDSFESATV